MREWFRLWLQPRVVRRGLKFAFIVGSVLITINHGDAIVNGTLSKENLLKMALTVSVPYFVSTLSSVSAILQTRKNAPPEKQPSAEVAEKKPKHQTID